MKLNIVTHPNKILDKPTAIVTNIDKHIELANSMHNMIMRLGAYGLAAPQVRRSLALCVVNTLKREDGIKRTMFNPVILWESEEDDVLFEECLSLPGQQLLIKRPKRIQVKYTNEHLQEKEEWFTDYNARVIKHEIDHLLGFTLLDYYEE